MFWLISKLENLVYLIYSLSLFQFFNFLMLKESASLEKMCDWHAESANLQKLSTVRNLATQWAGAIVG